jgi:hypothetical protein
MTRGSPIIVTARKPRPRKAPTAAAGMEISTEDHTKRGDEAEELFR